MIDYHEFIRDLAIYFHQKSLEEENRKGEFTLVEFEFDTPEELIIIKMEMYEEDIALGTPEP